VHSQLDQHTNWVRRVVETCNSKGPTKKIGVYNGHEVVLWREIRVQEADACVRVTNGIFRWMGCFQRTEETRIVGGITCSLFALSPTSDSYLTETWLPIRYCVDSTAGDYVYCNWPKSNNLVVLYSVRKKGRYQNLYRAVSEFHFRQISLFYNAV